jgi:DNA recombination protein RmuC
VTLPGIFILTDSQIIYALAGAFVALALAWVTGWRILTRREAAARDAEQQRWLPRLEALEREREGLAQRLERSETQLASERVAREQAERRAAESLVRLEEQQRASSERLRELEAVRERMKAEFQGLAVEILEDKSKRFAESNQQQLGQLLTPLREQLGDFRKTVYDVYEKEGHQRVALQAELKQLLELNRQLSDEAHSLTRALTTDNRTQGYWGELKLERLLEMAGLEKGQQYLTQESFRDDAGERYRPDALLLLPEERQIVIDAKVALLDFQRASEATDNDERSGHLDRHILAMRGHIKGLGDKDYSRLQGLRTPDLVLMFVPVEAAFLEALRRDPELYEYAFSRRIILVGPSNLLASLRLGAPIWRTEQQNSNAKAIAERGAILYDKFVGFVEDLGKVGEALDRAQRAHQSALGRLSQGRGNLVRQAEMLRDLGVAPGKRLPASAMDDQIGSDDEGGEPTGGS